MHVSSVVQPSTFLYLPGYQYISDRLSNLSMYTSDDLPLHAIGSWQAFRIDALGLVTMLGTDQLNRSVGRLVRNPYFEYLPLLSAFTVSSNQITEPVPGFSLYNVSSAITTNELSGWFSRWLLSQNLRRSGTKLEVTVDSRPRSLWRQEFSALAMAVLLTGPLIALSVLFGDWFGLANGLSMVVSVIVRWYVVEQNRNKIDEVAEEGMHKKPEMAKLLCVLPNAKSVIIHAPLGVVMNCLTADVLKPANPLLYTMARWTGWIAFTVHVISIGMCTLPIQIYTVVLVVLSSVLTVHRVGTNEDHIGRRLSIHRDENLKANPEPGRRMLTYVDLDLSDQEEAVMLEWNLFPKRCNTAWWDEYSHHRDMSRTNSEASTLMEKENPGSPTRKRSSDSISSTYSRRESMEGKRSPLPFPATMQP